MLVESKERNKVFWIVLNRPEKANALNAEMWEEFSKKVDEGAASQSATVIAIIGTGKYFSAGSDMAELARASTPAAAFDLFMGTMRSAFDKVLRCPKPVVAAVNGPALAAGVDLIFACDLAIALPDAYFALSQGKHGVGPALGLTLGIPVLGKKLLTEMAMTGRRVSAEEAERWGLINWVAKGAMENEVERLATQISETPPSLIRAMKEVMLRQMSMVGYENAFDYIAMFSQSKETREGIAKFLSKES